MLGESRLHQPLRLKPCSSKLTLGNSSTNQHCLWHGTSVLKDPSFPGGKDPSLFLASGAKHRHGGWHCISTTHFASTEICWQLQVLGLCRVCVQEVISKWTLNGCSHCWLNSKGCNEAALQVPTCNTLQVSREHGNELGMNVCTKGSRYTAQQKQQKLL